MASMEELKAVNILKNTKHDFTDTRSSESISIEIKEGTTARFRLIAKRVFRILFILSCIAEVANIISGFTQYRNSEISLLIAFVFSLCITITIIADTEYDFTQDKLKDAYKSAIQLKWVLEDMDISGPVYLKIIPIKVFKDSTDGKIEIEIKNKKTDDFSIATFFYKETLYEKEVKVPTFRVDTSRKSGTQLVLPESYRLN